MVPERKKHLISYELIEVREVLQEKLEDCGIYKTVDELYVPPHISYIGLEKFNDIEWSKGDLLFDLPLEHNLTYENIHTPCLFSTNEKKGRKTFFGHVIEGDKKGGYHFPWPSIGALGKIIGRRKKVGDKGAYRTDAVIDKKERGYRVMFPTDWDFDRFVKSLAQAYWSARYDQGNNFIGEDETGFPIRFSIDEEFSMTSAYPHYPEGFLSFLENKYPSLKKNKWWKKIKYFIPYINRNDK